MKKITLVINDQTHQISADPQMPLLWALRDQIGLTGTKYGCGKGLCGSCTVHVDGEAMRSCLLSIADIGKGKITTIEGLSNNNEHPVQQAWIKEDVAQCGFCQAGQIMNASALLKTNPKPTDENIIESMSGNLCRCGTYSRIKKAIKRAAEQNLLVKE